MGALSRNKGKRGEREFAKKLNEHGFHARRGVQYHGGPESPDIVSDLDDIIHFEVKRTERLSLYDAISQAKHDAGDKIPVVAHRRNNCEWLVVLRADDFLEMARELQLPVKNVC